MIAALVLPVSADEQIVTLGDSLTYAYESEFQFQRDLFPEGIVGDGMPASVRNWIEILSKSAPQSSSFDLGVRDSTTVTIPFNQVFQLYLRQRGNWAIPGLKIHEMKRFLYGEATFNEILASSPEFAGMVELLSYSDFNQTTDFNVSELRGQVQTTAEGLVVFIGGNDVRAKYGDIYNGIGAGTFIADYMADMTAILDKVQAWNPNIEIVVVNVPHVGITPLVRTTSPFDPVKTGRVTTVLRELNRQIAAIAETRQIGYADVFTPTLRMLDGSPLTIHGVTFDGGSGPANGDLDFVWLNGELSDNFHPNTNAQAVIANEIVHAFNQRYQRGIPLLTATQMLVNLSGKSAADVEIPFATWMAGFGLAGLGEADDSDGDGIAAGVEFALGLDPTRNDADYVTTGIAAGALELAFPQRLPGSAHVTLVAESSGDLAGGFSPMPMPPVAADGLFHAARPLDSTAGFLRLKATTAP